GSCHLLRSRGRWRWPRRTSAGRRPDRASRVSRSGREPGPLEMEAQGRVQVEPAYIPGAVAMDGAPVRLHDHPGVLQDFLHAAHELLALVLVDETERPVEQRVEFRIRETGLVPGG